MAFESTWTSAQLVTALCDILITKGHLKAKPAFIRTDRETKLTGIFETIGLDGEKMASVENPGTLEMLLRRGANGEVWLAHVQDAMVSMLPEEIRGKSKVMEMDQSAKDELEAAKEKSAARRQRLQEEGGGEERPERAPREDRGDRGGFDRGDREGGARAERPSDRGGFDRAPREDRGNRGSFEGGEGGGRFDRFGEDGGKGGAKGGGKGADRSEMECFNCNGFGHTARECDQPRKEKGKGKGYQKRSDRACFNCGEKGHNSRDCPEPQKLLHKDRDLGAMGMPAGEN